MNNKKDILYTNIVNDILMNEEFLKTKEIIHHGTSRFNHSVRVSYYSYKVAKILKLDYKETARAGLLHDFFIDTYEETNKTSLLYDHPYKAVENAKKYFELSNKEEDIIKTHMFPINPSVPKYAESWIVTFMDKVAAVLEYCNRFKYKVAYVSNFYLIFLVNFMK